MKSDEYQPEIDAIKGPPMLTPTASESVALSKALAEIAPALARTPERVKPEGLRGFVLASIAAFALVATMLALQTFGVVSIRSVVTSLGPLVIALALVVVVFVTSFVPIAVTARRRPLNGMTFRR